MKNEQAARNAGSSRGEYLCADGSSSDQADRSSSGDASIDESPECLRCGTAIEYNVRFCDECRTVDNPADYPTVDPSNDGAHEDGSPRRSARRRDVLLVGGATIGGIVGSTVFLHETITETMNTIAFSVGRYWRDHHLAGVGMENVEWDGSTLALVPDSDHRSDGWGLVHASGDPIEDALVMGTTERETRIELPFRSIIEDGPNPADDPTYLLVVYEGTFARWDDDHSVHEPVSVLDTLEFEPPETVLERSG